MGESDSRHPQCRRRPPLHTQRASHVFRSPALPSLNYTQNFLLVIQKQRTLRNRLIQAPCCKLATATLRKAHTCSFQRQDVERKRGQWVSECEGEHCGLRVKVPFIPVPGTSPMVSWLGICLAM